MFDRIDVKGTLIESRSRLVTARWGAVALERLCEGLEADAAAALRRPPFSSTWVPVTLLTQIDHAMIALFFSGDAHHMQGVGADVARFDLANLYRTLLRVGRPRFIAQRFNVAYMTYVRQGEMRSLAIEDQSATVILDGVVLPRYFCRFHISGWLEAALQLSGANTAHAEHVQCRNDGDAGCQWELAWT